MDAKEIIKRLDELQPNNLDIFDEPVDPVIFTKNKEIVKRLLLELHHLTSVIPQEDGSFTLLFNNKINFTIGMFVFDGEYIMVYQKGKKSIRCTVDDAIELVNTLVP